MKDGPTNKGETISRKTINVRLSREEELYVVDWLEGAFNSRPDDWDIGETVICDRKTGIEIFVQHRRRGLCLNKPHLTKPFRWRAGWRLWQAIRRLERRQGHDIFSHVRSAMENHQPPPSG